jgi:hypothetical protein
MVTVWRLVPVTRNFFIMPAVVMPFRTDPYVVSTRPGGAFDHVFVRSFFDVIMLSAGGKRGQGKGGSEEGGNH